jgi:hypothetical protein
MEDEKQEIFHHKVSLSWKKRIGNGYTNHTRGVEIRPYEFVSRGKTLEDMNSNPQLMMQIMVHIGIGNSKVYDFHINEIYDSKSLGDSFNYKESDYNNEFKK